MGDYKITVKGLVVLLLITALAIFSIIKGSIYLAVFCFVFFSAVLAATLYEVFINR